MRKFFLVTAILFSALTSNADGGYSTPGACGVSLTCPNGVPISCTATSQFIQPKCESDGVYYVRCSGVGRYGRVPYTTEASENCNGRQKN